MHIKDLQNEIKKRDYNPDLRLQYFLKLSEEVGELANAIRKDERMRMGANGQKNIKGTIDEELYDVMYYVLALANLYDVDMEEAVKLKEELNKKRVDH